MPEWHLLGLTFATLTMLGVDWQPLGLFLPLLLLTFGASLLQAGLSAAHAPFTSTLGSPNALLTRLKLGAITTLLHLLQPLARLSGRLSYVGAPRQKRVAWGLWLPRPRASTVWSELWRAPGEWLRSVEVALQKAGTVSLRGGDYDRWDIEVRGGMLGSARTLTAIEEHGGGKQLVRFHTWPRCSSAGVVVIVLFATLSGGAAFDHAWITSAILGIVTAMLALRMLRECSVATAAILSAIDACDNAVTMSSPIDQSELHETW
jgi:hypothetical protein